MSRSCRKLAAAAVHSRSGLAAAPPARAHTLPFRLYRSADGLARDAVLRVVPDRRGFVWFATEEGISRFDGREFRNYGPGEGLPPQSVWDLLPARDGSTWAATSAGVYRMAPGATAVAAPLFALVPLGGAEPAPRARRLFEDDAGRIWVATQTGVFVFEREGDAWRPSAVPLIDERGAVLSAPVRAFAADRDGGLWIATRNDGIFRTQPDAGSAVRWPMSLTAPMDVRALLGDRLGRLWVGTLDGILLLTPDRARRAFDARMAVRAAEGLPSSSVQDLAWTADRRMVAGTDGGAAIIAGAEDAAAPLVVPLTRDDGLPAVRILAVAEDDDGDLWFGAANEGAVRLARRGFVSFGPRDGLRFLANAGLTFDRAGRAVLATRLLPLAFVVNRFDGARFSSASVKLPPGFRDLGWGSHSVAIETRDGDWWIAAGDGLLQYRGRRSLQDLEARPPDRIYGEADGLPSSSAFSLFEARDGTLWVGSGSVSLRFPCLARRRPGTDRFESPTLGDPLRRGGLPNGFAEDRSGALWIAYENGGLARVRGDRLEPVGDRSVDDIVPAGVFADSRGRVWAFGAGLVRIDDPAAEQPTSRIYGVADGLSSRDVNCATEDRWGRIYFGTGRGVDRLDPATGSIAHFTADDGLPVDEVRVCGTDGAGALWFVSDGAVSRLVPEPDAPADPPQVLVAGVRVAGVAAAVPEMGTALVDGLVLAPGQRQLAIDVLGLGGATRQIRFRFRLSGADEAWSAPQPERTISFAHLAPGRYRFEARAVDEGGRESVVPAVVAFTVQAPVWRRAWFLALAGVLLALAGWLLYRAHVSRLVEIERLRTRIAMDLHDELGSALGGIGILAGVAAEEEVSEIERRALARRAADAAGELGHALTEIVWTLRPGNTRLDALAYHLAEQGGRLFAGRARFATEFPAAWPHATMTLAVQRHVQRIALEALHNAAQHAGASRVTLGLVPAERGWTLWVEDDGRGIDPDAVPREGGGLGLAAMRQRAASIGATLRIESPAAGGTRVTLHFDPRGRERKAPPAIRPADRGPRG